MYNVFFTEPVLKCWSIQISKVTKQPQCTATEENKIKTPALDQFSFVMCMKEVSYANQGCI